MVEFLDTMVEWFQRNNGKNHVTNKVNERKPNKTSKKVVTSLRNITNI